MYSFLIVMMLQYFIHLPRCESVLLEVGLESLVLRAALLADPRGPRPAVHLQEVNVRPEDETSELRFENRSKLSIVNWTISREGYCENYPHYSMRQIKMRFIDY